MSPKPIRRPKLRIGLFGGTFDPIHRGHLAVARAAQRRLGLDLIHFVPCGRPPHKARPNLSPYLHRFTMVSLACMEKPGLVPSLLEAGPDLQGRRRYYSIETVRRVRRVAGKQAELYFLVGADSFLYLEEWENFRALIRYCDFVVASRPGFDWGDARVNFARTWGKPGEKGTGSKIRLPSGAIHFLPRVRVDVSSSEIRHWARCGRSLQGSVPGAVADYIEKLGLYRKKR